MDNDEQSQGVEIMDGSLDPRSAKMNFSRKRSTGDLCAIFVHAGAGYHSIQNERVHLSACENAARSAMEFLRNGSTAVDAIEAAIRVLEDNEITNAGFGSNLSMDGTVEGDATIVDHLGRAGAVGAIGNVVNPIHVARLLLDETTQPLSLRRVPPNLLVGQGAVDYAYLHKVPILPNDALVSPAARERWCRWSKDLRMAHDHTEPAADIKDIAALRNEGQPYSPVPKQEMPVQLRNSSRNFDRRPSNYRHSPLMQSSASSNTYEETVGSSSHNPVIVGDSNEDPTLPAMLPGSFDLDPLISTFPEENEFTSSIGPPFEPDLSMFSQENTGVPHAGAAYVPQPAPGEDVITDTVGAIAIDSTGKIAAGSSSGGIGMKYKGRIGPAALVGVGTAVIPVSPKDKEHTSVAAVTSGTGEHMATTMAANTCANRLYNGEAMSKKGVVEAATEDEAIQNFIKYDFMKHPSVEASHSVGAIGVMAVKRNVDGLWLHFAHNTDSFALASMSSDDAEPWSVMSRSKPGSGSGSCTSGGRSMYSNSFHRGLPGFKRQKRTKSDPETSSTQVQAPTTPLTVYTGAVLPDGNSVSWQPVPEVSIKPTHGPLGQSPPDDGMIG